MGMKVALMLCLFVGSCASAAHAGKAGSLVLPPAEVVGQIRVVDRVEGRIVMQERNRELFATDPRQLDGLGEGQKVRVRFQRDYGRELIYSIVPVSN